MGVPITEEDIRFEVVSDLANKCTKLNISVSKEGWIIKGVVLENEQLFKDNGGIFYQMQSVGLSTVSVRLSNAKN